MEVLLVPGFALSHTSHLVADPSLTRVQTKHCHGSSDVEDCWEFGNEVELDDFVSSFLCLLLFFSSASLTSLEIGRPCALTSGREWVGIGGG